MAIFTGTSNSSTRASLFNSHLQPFKSVLSINDAKGTYLCRIEFD